MSFSMTFWLVWRLARLWLLPFPRIWKRWLWANLRSCRKREGRRERLGLAEASSLEWMLRKRERRWERSLRLFVRERGGERLRMLRARGSRTSSTELLLACLQRSYE